MLHCRSCLDSEAPPSLTAAAAALAGGFVEAGLAGSDPALLTRLMAQLIALLKAKASKRQQQLYSEWVPLQAYLALLQAHAQFATAGESVLDADSRHVVQSAQESHHRSAFLLAVAAHFPWKDASNNTHGNGLANIICILYSFIGTGRAVSLWLTVRSKPTEQLLTSPNVCKQLLNLEVTCKIRACIPDADVVHYLVTTMVGLCRQLVAAWVAVVQDYAVLGTHGPLVQAAYTPRLFPAPSLSIIARLQPNLHSCWPAALAALAVTLPQAAGGYLSPDLHLV